MPERIGFYICHCGINIAYRVRVKEVAKYASAFPGVAIARDYLFMCSDPGQELIESDIKKYNLTRVVVASCSPRMHEKTFRAACQRAGLNPFYAFHMVCVREHDSWVTEDEDEATQKAIILSMAGLKRVSYQNALTPSRFKVNTNTLVVGGGIAGMQASLDIASAGFKAFLIENQPTVGGHMLQYDKTFPTLDCAACIGTPKMVEVGQSKNVELMTYTEVESVDGFIGNFKVTVNKKARYIKSNCTGCDECAKVCPVELPNEWDANTKIRKAVYIAFPQAVPVRYAIDKKSTAPCRTSCPAGTNVQGYVQMVKIGNYQQALNIIMERLPLPGVLGRVCPHPCETDCRRALVDSPVSIRDLKRFAADNAKLEDVPRPETEEIDKQIAVIGSGPAGLTVAYYLWLKGFKVTVFESMEKPGGMLRTGIPDYRLPPAILDQEIDNIISTGIALKTGMALGKDFTLASLKEQGFDAIFLGIGAHIPVKMNIENEDADGVIDAVPFLRKENLESAKSAKKRVVVIGGGNVAMDAARVAIRSGAESVTIVYRRTEKEMPADHEEIEGAKEEGIEFVNLGGPKKAVTENGKVVGIECIKNELGPADDSGRRRPVPIEGSEYVIDCDMIIPAIGQKVETAPIIKEADFSLTAWGTFNVDHKTMQTSVPGIFAAGDSVTGPATVVEAVAGGHKAVKAIERYLNGAMELFEAEKETEDAEPDKKDFVPIPEDVVTVERAEPVFTKPASRKNSFEEFDKGLDEATAIRDAEKCLNCGGCCECKLCVDQCKAQAIDHEMQDEKEVIDVGSIIVATGFDPLDPTPMTQYGYGKYPNVFTNIEFERLSNATGPTSGKLLKRDLKNPLQFTEPPKSVAILHCIGSRDINYHEYCSRTCCMYALKYAHLLKDKCGHDTEIYNFYIDMRCFGKGYEEFYQKVQAEGVRMIRGKVGSITEDANGLLTVRAEDTLSACMVEIEVEMAILCTAMEPRSDAKEVMRTFGIGVGSDGFFQEEHPKLAPVSTPSSGVFLAGACQGPKDIPDTVAQAKGAAAECLALSASGEVEVPPMISDIDPDICIGCQICIGLCPYTAIEFNELKGVAEVNSAICKGCGSCAGYCPSGAAKVRHFTDKQIFAEIDGLLAA
ncbi:FAD-dependent oxidoreductase [Desulfococcaceae bacterium HSG9]|nr:FAD-dependent oxidoreductase [Desulfococcaceae bacterium HSG9]